MVNVIPFLATTVMAAVSLFFMRKRVNVMLMRFFRDLSRYKTRKRLYGNSAALIPLLMGQEARIEIDTSKSEYGEDFTMTLSELREMDGRTETTPVYISLAGLIYDVSSARAMYGPGGGYQVFAGVDGTRGFATGCTEAKCLEGADEDLGEFEMSQLDKWVELYHTHDKYKFVGRLVDDPVDQIMAKDESEELARASEEGTGDDEAENEVEIEVD